MNKFLSHLQSGMLWLYQHRLQIGFVLFVAYVLLQKDITLQLSLNSPAWGAPAASNDTRTNELSILTPLGKHISAKGKSLAKDPEREAYLHRFAPIAQQEMKKYGIPASIKLAQGLLESDGGKSPLARKNNNHFGIKCFSKSCKKGHCSNFSDDSHKDFFRIYTNAWESYRAHSLFLQNKRYEPLFSNEPTDYRTWARGLAKAGYATDPGYARKLIDLIEELKLYRFDANP